LFKFSVDTPLTRDTSGTLSVVFLPEASLFGFPGGLGLTGKAGLGGKTGFFPSSSLLPVRCTGDFFSIWGEIGGLPMRGFLGGFFTGGIGDCLLRLSRDSFKLEFDERFELTLDKVLRRFASTWSFGARLSDTTRRRSLLFGPTGGA
jgi:hypothetical protein